MSIDRTDVNLTFGGAQRIDAIRRVERDAPSKQPGDKDGRGKRDDNPDSGAHEHEVPHDIVDVHPVGAPGEVPAHPQVLRPAAPTPPDTERHLDIQV